MEKYHSQTTMKIYPVGLIYITVCIHPSKKGMMYVGSHCRNDPGYLGSGSLLRYYIKKLGPHYFKRYTIAEYSQITRDQLLSYEDQWLEVLDAVNSSMFWNQKVRASGGNLVKDSIVHGDKTRQGMVASGAIKKLQQHARKSENLESSKRKLASITPEQRELGIQNRRNKTTWYEDICSRNKQMVHDPVWKKNHNMGIMNRDRFIHTPEGIFKNAVDAGEVFKVSNNAILNKVHDIRYPEWYFLDTKDHNISFPEKFDSEERDRLCKKYFTKFKKVAHNKIPVIVQGKQYSSKTEARKVLKWSQERLENHLKKESLNG
jgi:hypothetical protein